MPDILGTYFLGAFSMTEELTTSRYFDDDRLVLSLQLLFILSMTHFDR